MSRTDYKCLFSKLPRAKILARSLPASIACGQTKNKLVAVHGSRFYETSYMATFNPQMWPPDRGQFKRDPGAQTQESMTIFEKIVRYAEKDDILLYATAVFGIIMPAIMYFVYRKVHAKYQIYAKRKREERKKERARERAITFFYMTTENYLKRIAFSLAEQLEGFDPLVIALAPPNLKILYNYKGTAVFIVPDIETSSLSEGDGWFFDWLQEMRFEAKEKDLLSAVNYAIFSINGPEQQEMASIFVKRLNALGAKEIQPPTFIWNNKDMDMEIQIEEQGEFLLDSMKNAWDDYDSDETDLMSAEDTMSDEYSEPEVDPKDKKTN